MNAKPIYRWIARLALLLAIPCGVATAATNSFEWKFDLPPATSVGAAVVQDTDSVSGLVGAAVLQGSATATYANAEPTTGGTSSILLNNPGTANNNGAYISVPDNDLLTGHASGGTGFTSLTIDAWINPAELKQAQIVRKTDGNYNGFDFFMTAAGNLLLGVHGYGDDYSYVASSAVLQTGVWQHVVGSWDGVAGELKVSIDGVESTSPSLTTVLRNTDGPLAIGALIRAPGNTGQFFNGMLDSLKVSGTWSTDPQVDPGLTPLTPVAYWPMDLPAGAALNDTIQSVESTTYSLSAMGIIQSTSTLTYATSAPGGGSASAFFGNANTGNDNGSYLRVPNSNRLTGYYAGGTGYSAFEFDLWFRADEVRQCVLLRITAPGHNGMSIYTRTDNRILVQIYDADKTMAQLYSLNTYTVGQWSHLTIRWDRTRRSYEGDLSVTLDGTTAYLTSSFNEVADLTGDFSIGALIRDDATTGQFFRGNIDEVRYSAYPVPATITAASPSWLLY